MEWRKNNHTAYSVTFKTETKTNIFIHPSYLSRNSNFIAVSFEPVYSFITPSCAFIWLIATVILSSSYLKDHENPFFFVCMKNVKKSSLKCKTPTFSWASNVF